MSDCSRYVLADDAPVESRTEHVDRPDSSWSDGRDVPEGPDGGPNTTPGSEPTMEEVLRIVFDVGVGEREAYVALTGLDRSSAGDLAEILGRDRSNVNRYLNNLHQKGLVTRRRRILQSGGHVYEYSARSPEHVQALLLAGLKEWTDTASERIEQLLAETTEKTEPTEPAERAETAERVTT